MRNSLGRFLILLLRDIADGVFQLFPGFSEERVAGLRFRQERCYDSSDDDSRRGKHQGLLLSNRRQPAGPILDRLFSGYGGIRHFVGGAADRALRGMESASGIAGRRRSGLGNARGP